jgi:hypothetical protein
LITVVVTVGVAHEVARAAASIEQDALPVIPVVAWRCAFIIDAALASLVFELLRERVGQLLSPKTSSRSYSPTGSRHFFGQSATVIPFVKVHSGLSRPLRD